LAFVVEMICSTFAYVLKPNLNINYLSLLNFLGIYGLMIIAALEQSRLNFDSTLK